MQKKMQKGRLYPRKFSILNFLFHYQNLIIDITAAIFIFLFLYTALSKSLSIGSTVTVLEKTPILSNHAVELAWGVVLIEYSLATLLIFPKTKILGLFLSVAVMTGFTTYIIYMMIFAPSLPCSCGGVISSLTWTQHLFFNLSFILLGSIALFLNRKPVMQEQTELPPTIFT